MGFFDQVVFEDPTVLPQDESRERLSPARESHSYGDYLEKSFPVILHQTNMTAPFTAPGIGVAQLTHGHLLQQILLDPFLL